MSLRVQAAAMSTALTKREPRILIVDIETSPNLCYVWSLYGEQHISPSQVVEQSRVLCFAAKWLDKKATEFYSEHHHDRDEMIRQSWRLFDEAEVVITYNGPSFDIRHLQREWLMAGLGPPSPWVDVDLLRVNRARFKFPSSKLGAVTDTLGLPTKLETGGQTLWNEVLKGDPKAWALFKRYNIRDVEVTEALYRVLRPWLKGPHMGQWMRDSACCFSCGSRELTFTGLVYGRAMSYPKFRCDGCGAWNKLLRNGQTRAA